MVERSGCTTAPRACVTAKQRNILMFKARNEKISWHLSCSTCDFCPFALFMDAFGNLSERNGKNSLEERVVRAGLDGSDYSTKLKTRF